MGTSLYEDDSTRCFAHCFETTWDGPIAHADQEMVWGEWVTLTRLSELLRRTAHFYTTQTCTPLSKTVQNRDEPDGIEKLCTSEWRVSGDRRGTSARGTGRRQAGQKLGSTS